MIVDGDQNRLDIAEKLGTAYTVDFMKEDAMAKVKEITKTGVKVEIRVMTQTKDLSEIDIINSCKRKDFKDKIII